MKGLFKFPCQIYSAERRSLFFHKFIVGFSGEGMRGVIPVQARALSSKIIGPGKILHSPYPDVHVPEENLAGFLMKEFPKHHSRLALVNGETGEQWTYSQLTDAVTSAGSAFVQLGISKGDVVTIFSQNCPEFVIAYLAIIAVGAIVSCVNPAYTSGELETALIHNGTKMLIISSHLWPIAQDIIENCTAIEKVLTFGSVDGHQPFSTLLQHNREHFPDNLDVNAMDDVCALPFSSGTTGLPKGVMLTHYNLVANCLQTRPKSVMGYEYGTESFVAYLPFYHLYGQAVKMLFGLQFGATLTTLRQFEPQQFLDCCQQSQMTYLHLVPPIALFFEKHPLVDKYEFSNVHSAFVGAAPVGPKTVEVLKEKLHIKNFKQGYGLTETSPITHCTADENSPIGSIGFTVPNMMSKFSDTQTGDILGPNTEGELLVRGPNVMKGYFKNEEATANSIKDGWLHTGDVGYYDEDGHVYISDRLKELIKVKGFQVAPAELEALLVTHSKIQDAAVIGKPDERAGELPRAYVVLKPNQEMSEDEVKAFVAGKTATFKHLHGGVEFCQSIPRSPSGKILRRTLKETLSNQ